MKNTRFYLAVVNKEVFKDYYNEFKFQVDSLTEEERNQVLNKEDVTEFLNRQPEVV